MLELHAVVNLDEQKIEKCMLLSILKKIIERYIVFNQCCFHTHALARNLEFGI